MHMTLHAYAKALPVTAAARTTGHEPDCEAYENDTRAKIDRLERTIVVEGEPAEALRTRLLQIAERCPVHRNLRAWTAWPKRDPLGLLKGAEQQAV